MKVIRTTKIKISGSSKAKKIIPDYLKALNWISEIVFKTEELNSNRLAKSYYSVFREKFDLPSQLACSICKQITATYKAAKSNKRWKQAVFKNATIPLVWKRDFNRGHKGVTLWGETLNILSPWLPLGEWVGSKLKQRDGALYLILSYEIIVPEPKTTGCIVGVDSGVKRMLVASNSSNNKTFFFHGGRLNHLRKNIRLRRAKIQAVGTRSARRLLVRLKHKEAAITEHLLHVASKALTQYAQQVDARMVVFEDLNVRDNPAELRKKRQDFKESICRWPYAGLQFKAGYKLENFGIGMSQVHPAYTSQKCPRCGHIAEGNRRGAHFRCVACGHKGDADLTASENIRNRYVAREHVSLATGSVNPLKRSELSEIDSHTCLSV